ncbi:outer membrane lipoprotein-sorting protein [Aquimarina algiphila]|uniref:Outer membrane lipoprotein-sorting protein n=1 Tax=Aquimarina algiphila TaxID=2047982 RepID=A0A554VJ32_9FLAO|nr:outer membrane lipoprotein-sorting protein [Aquimarina algiphila]TSE07813.1 outer membrane lipoprotein-sorting protein [Aquimarina algiphila]
MKKNVITIFALIFTVLNYGQDAKQLITEMMNTLGGKQNFYAKGNVSYDYEYINQTAKIHLKSKETYVFDKELSYAKYSEHSLLGDAGKVIEGFDGQNAWVSINGILSTDEKANGIARFLRKTNYYWFAMFFKLLDEGVHHELMGSKKVNGQDYHLIKMTFGNNIGDVKDTYVLYINKATKLVDQFLFTVEGFGIKEPSLMTFEYETIDGIKIATKRKYIEANWNGEIIGKQYTTTNWTNIKFKTDIDTSIFMKQ